MDTWRSTTVKTYSRKRKHSTFLADFDAKQDNENDQRFVAASSLPSPPLSSSPMAPLDIPKETRRHHHHHHHHLLTPSTPFHNTIRRQWRKARKLTQLTIDLGNGNTPKQCTTCGMEYVSSNPEDAKTHRDFHSASIGGINVPAGVAAKWKVKRRLSKRLAHGTDKSLVTKKMRSENSDLVVEVNQNDTAAVQKYAKSVLAVAEQDLGAVTVCDGLWSNTHCPKQKVYLYVQDNKCIGLCLAERIRSAFVVQPDDVNGDAATPSSSSSISRALELEPAALGISRIWVSREFRGLGIAQQLLETTRQEFDYGLAIAMDKVAFSQPTNSGIQLARAWFGKDHGWLVYENDGEARHYKTTETS